MLARPRCSMHDRFLGRQHLRPRLLEVAGLLLVGALLFVWSLPGTIALRSLLLLAAILLLSSTLTRANFRRTVGMARLPLLLIGLLTLWFVVQAVSISPETAWALGELYSQWLPALLSLALGLMLGRSTGQGNGNGAGTSMLATGVVLVLGLQAAIAVAQSIWHWMSHGELIRQLVPLTGGKLEMSFVLNLLLAFLTVDFFCRATRRPPILQLPQWAVLALLLVAFASAYLAGARNGILGILFLSVSAISLFVFDQRRRLGVARTLFSACAIVIALAAFGVVHYQSDPRWQTFSETAKLAWKIDFKTPLEDDWNKLPRLSNGQPADQSAYVRISFIRTGLDLIAQLPLGHGYGRNAFGHALMALGQARHGHAHSGWIDLGVGGGWPALLLWAAFLANLIAAGLLAFLKRGNPHGLLLFFITTGFAGRMVLDSVNKDHMLQMFLFLAGLLLILARRQDAAA